MNRKQAVSLVLRIGLSALMLGDPDLAHPADRPRRGPPAARRPHRRLARAWPWRSPSSALSCRRCAGSGCSRCSGSTPACGGWCRYCLAGQFVSNVLPTTIGGDVLRVARLSRDTGETPKTFASVVLERLTGWLVLPLISVVGFLVNPPLRDLGRATQVALGMAFATLMALCILLYAVADQRIGGRFEAKDGWRRFAGAVHLGLDRMRHEPAATANVLFVGFAYQLVLVLAAVAAAQALGRATGRAHRAARLLPRRRHRPGAADRHLRPRRPRGRLRAVPRSARRRRRRTRSPSASSSTSSTSA